MSYIRYTESFEWIESEREGMVYVYPTGSHISGLPSRKDALLEVVMRMMDQSG